MENKFEYIPTTTMTDALNSQNYMEIDIKPLNQEWTTIGPAFTVNIDGGENLSVLEAIYKARPEDVLVIDGKGWLNHAFAGDFIIGLAKTKGINGIVDDGVIRDIKGVKDLDYPVFCKGTTTAAGKKNKVGSLNQDITCGGVKVSPGDIIVADADGVAVVPRDEQEQVFEKAKDRLQRDIKREEKVGTDIKEVNKYLEEVLKSNNISLD